MKKLAFAISLILVMAIFVVSCTNQVPDQQENLNPQDNQYIEPESDTSQYIDSQFVDQNETVEIGELI